MVFTLTEFVFGAAMSYVFLWLLANVPAPFVLRIVAAMASSLPFIAVVYMAMHHGWPSGSALWFRLGFFVGWIVCIRIVLYKQSRKRHTARTHR